jgi:hypothetical protein
MHESACELRRINLLRRSVNKGPATATEGVSALYRLTADRYEGYAHPTSAAQALTNVASSTDA